MVITLTLFEFAGLIGAYLAAIAIGIEFVPLKERSRADR